MNPLAFSGDTISTILWTAFSTSVESFFHKLVIKGKYNTDCIEFNSKNSINVASIEIGLSQSSI